MKLLISPQALERVSDPIGGTFMDPVIKEAIRHGLDIVKTEHNPFYWGSKVTLWFDKSCPLAIYHHRAQDYALIFENPLHPGSPRLDDKYFETLLPHCVEMTLV